MRVLVDTSIWVSYLRSGKGPTSDELDTLLEAAEVATCTPIRAEVVSGARTQSEFKRLRHLFSALPHVALTDNFWSLAEYARFQLARIGHQATLVDLLIAITAKQHGLALWTADNDFDPITKLLDPGRYVLKAHSRA